MNIKNNIINFFRLFPFFVRDIEYHFQEFIGFNERAVEYAFVFKWLNKLCPVNVLDVGSGNTALPHLMRTFGPYVEAIDKRRTFNRHWKVKKRDITKRVEFLQSFDVITCISTLEHIEWSGEAISRMFQLLRPGGCLILTFPYTENEYFGNVYEDPRSDAYGKDLDYICQSFSRVHLDVWFGDKIIEQEYWKCWNGDKWSVGIRTRPEQVTKDDWHQLTCLVVRKPHESSNSH